MPTLRNLARYVFRPVYVARRIAQKLYEYRHPHLPWIAQGAIAFCDEHLRRDGCGLEWGSGRSTAWFAQRLKTLLSVEHDAGWHARVTETLRAKGIENAVCRHVPLDHPLEEPCVERYDPLPAYVRVADEFPDASLDLVVVDGHYRQACILAALPKLRPGGLLLVDNTDWMPLADWPVPRDWPIAHQSRNVLTETTIWRRP